MKTLSVIIVCFLIFAVGYFVGLREGNDEGARQMARHILNPAFETDGFYIIMGEECGGDKGWIEMNDGSWLIYKDGVTLTNSMFSAGE